MKDEMKEYYTLTCDISQIYCLEIDELGVD